MRATYIDLTAYPDTSRRIAAVSLLRNYQYICTEDITPVGLRGVVVYYDDDEDIEKSPAYPHGCPHRPWHG